MADDNGPWWVQDKETGHQFVSFVQADHLEVVKDESPYRSDGVTLRLPEPADEVKASKTAKKETGK